MSNARAKARAEREAEAARRAVLDQERRDREAAERARRERRSLIWRRMRLWQHGSGFDRRKEGWAALATLALVLIVLAFVLSGSFRAVFLVVLVLVVGAPALIMITFDRRRR